MSSSYNTFTKVLAAFMSQLCVFKLVFELCLLFSQRGSSFYLAFSELKLHRYEGAVGAFGRMYHMECLCYYGLVCDIVASVLAGILFSICTKGKGRNIDGSSRISTFIIFAVTVLDIVATNLGSGITSLYYRNIAIPLFWILPFTVYFILMKNKEKSGEVFSTVILPQQPFKYPQAGPCQGQNWIFYNHQFAEPINFSNPFNRSMHEEHHDSPIKTPIVINPLQISATSQLPPQGSNTFSGTQQAGPDMPPLYNLPIDGFPSKSDMKM